MVRPAIEPTLALLKWDVAYDVQPSNLDPQVHDVLIRCKISKKKAPTPTNAIHTHVVGMAHEARECLRPGMAHACTQSHPKRLGSMFLGCPFSDPPLKVTHF